MSVGNSLPFKTNGNIFISYYHIHRFPITFDKILDESMEAKTSSKVEDRVEGDSCFNVIDRTSGDRI